MTPTRRALLVAAGAAFASSGSASAAPSYKPDGVAAASNDAANELLVRSAESNSALMRGDIDRYRALNPYSDDFTLMSPFGGPPTHARDLTSERWAAMGRFFRKGTFSQEVVQAYGTAEMVTLAIIEHCNVEVGDLPAQHWPLRVTLVYRRDGAAWRLVHRHADPLKRGTACVEGCGLRSGFQASVTHGYLRLLTPRPI